MVVQYLNINQINSCERNFNSFSHVGEGFSEEEHGDLQDINVRLNFFYYINNAGYLKRK